MRYIAFFILLFALVFILFMPVSKVSLPAPTQGETEVKMDGDESGNQNKREAWFTLLHQAAPDVDWREIEKENSFTNARIVRDLRNALVSRNDDEWVAGGNIKGKWYERGSTNQAGSVIAAAYDREADEIFVVSAGGSIFKGYRSGIGWEVINQDLRFSENLMETVQLPNGNRRLIASIQHGPYFSDDEGKTWKAAAGVSGVDGGYLYHTAKSKDQKILFLQKRSHWATLRLCLSENNGENYSIIHTFGTHENKKIAMAMEATTENVFVIEQLDAQKSNIRRYDHQNKTWELLTENSPISFGNDGTGNLQVVTDDGQTKMYVYDANLRLHVSVDFGKTWEFLSTLPTKPWSVSLFVSPSKPKQMMYGEVDAFRSRDGGKTWQKINAWWEYYSNVQSKLHADIMALKEFEDPDGNPFVLISNHGGMSITYDTGVKNDNIGLFDLNVSQYYDVKSYPLDHNFVFAGAQDQGFQKGFIPGTNPEPFVQVISGDYGHIAFTDYGQRLWTVYPGGWVTYYPNPRNSGSVASFEINSDNESVWIPPIVASPIESENAVYMAGGNINGGPGSHLVKLTYNAQQNRIDATQSPFNFRPSGGELSAIAFSPFNPNKVYCATTNGRFYISENGGQHFSYHAFSLPAAQYLYGSCILPSKIDSNIVYISGSGYSTPGVMISRNGGKTFSALNNSLPKTTVFKIVANEDESLIYAATESGPYVYIKALDKWFLLSGSNTPNQTFWSVEYIPALKLARFGTYGRGIWDFHFKDLTTSIQEQNTLSSGFRLYPNPANEFLYIQTKDIFIQSASFSVFDIRGNKISLPIERVGENVFRLQTESLQEGVYIVVDNRGKSGKVQKFVKTK